MPTIGQRGDELSGIESRCVRAALNLERRHVAVLVTATGLWPRGRCATGDVAAWERSKGRGYPESVTSELHTLDAAVNGLACMLIEEASRNEEEEVATVCRPKRPERVRQLLWLSAAGLDWSPAVIEELDDECGDFWERLADAAVLRAAGALNTEDWVTRVVLDREDDDAA